MPEFTAEMRKRLECFCDSIESINPIITVDLQESQDIRAALARLDAVERERDAAKEDAECSWGCLAMIRDRLQAIGCKCGPDAHEATPPMMYDDWIACVVQSKTEELRRERDAAKASLLQTESN